MSEKPRRGMFDGLKLGLGRGASAGVGEATGRSAGASDPLAERARLLSPFEQALDGYAQAHGVVERQRQAGLPLLEGQRQVLRAAGERLEQARAGSQALLRAALEHDPQAATAMAELSGRARVGQLVAGLERERAAQADPDVRAERFVARWQALDGQRQQLRGWQHDAPRGEVEAQMRGLAQSLERDPQAAAALRSHRQELGIGSQGQQGEGIAQALQRSLVPGRRQSLGRGM